MNTAHGPPVAIPVKVEGNIVGIMKMLGDVLNLPIERRFGVLTLGTLSAMNDGGVMEIPANLIPAHLVTSAQVVEFFVDEDGGMDWLPIDLASVVKQ